MCNVHFDIWFDWWLYRSQEVIWVKVWRHNALKAQCWNVFVQARRRLLLTGTPLQNNLIELMSLLVFLMPDLFVDKTDILKRIFTSFGVRKIACLLQIVLLFYQLFSLCHGFHYNFSVWCLIFFCRYVDACWWLQGNGEGRGTYEEETIAHAKHILKPFFLRRLKSEVW